MIRIILYLLCLCGPAFAGPWLQDKKRGFLSINTEIGPNDSIADLDQFTSFYLEYGLTPKTTIGLDIGTTGGNFAKQILFLRRGVNLRPKNWVASYELGLGTVEGMTVLRSGASLGRGIRLGQKSGWVALDLRYAYGELFFNALETDLTLGLNWHKNLTGLVQLRYANPSTGSQTFRFAPGLLLGRSDKRRWKVGVSTDLTGNSESRLELGFWQNF